MWQLPADWQNQFYSNVENVMTGAWPLVFLIVGVIIGSAILDMIVELAVERKNKILYKENQDVEKTTLDE